MRSIRAGLVGLIVCGTGACASPGAGAKTGETTAPAAERPQPSAAEQIAWSGSLQPMQERTGYAAPTKQQKAYGTVRLEPTARDLNRTAVSIVISTAIQEPTMLRWAIVPGRCGSSALPIVGYEQFPMLEVGTNGRGQLNVELPLALPYDGVFHVAVYRGDQSQHGSGRLQDVLTCANLKRGG
jgi:hypothetical protein